jgi:hypothetical protein
MSLFFQRRLTVVELEQSTFEERQQRALRTFVVAVRRQQQEQHIFKMNRFK